MGGNDFIKVLIFDSKTIIHDKKFQQMIVLLLKMLLWFRGFKNYFINRALFYTGEKTALLAWFFGAF